MRGRKKKPLGKKKDSDSSSVTSPRATRKRKNQDVNISFCDTIDHVNSKSLDENSFIVIEDDSDMEVTSVIYSSSDFKTVKDPPVLLGCRKEKVNKDHDSEQLNNFDLEVIECATEVTTSSDVNTVKDPSVHPGCVREKKLNSDIDPEQLNNSRIEDAEVLTTSSNVNALEDSSVQLECVINTKLNEDDKPEQSHKMKQARRRFPDLNELLKEDNPVDETCKIYTSQIERFIQKKQETNVAVKDLLSILTDEESSNDVPETLSKKVEDIENGNKEATSVRMLRSPRRKRKSKCGKSKKKCKSTEELYSNLDKLISEHEENRIAVDDYLEKDMDLYASFSPIRLEKKHIIYIKCKAKVFTFRLESNEPFSKLLPELSSKLDMPSSRVLLFLNEDLLSDSKTPSEVNLKPGEIIECFISAEKSDTTSRNENQNMIEVKVQSNTDRQKVTIKCNKDEPLLKVLKEYALLKNVKIEQLGMKFDGENVDCNETPSEIGLEDGDCIDVIVQL